MLHQPRHERIPRAFAMRFCQGKVDVHAVSALVRQRLWRKICPQAVSHRDRAHNRRKRDRVVRRAHRVAITKIDLVLPRAVFMMRALRADAHFAQRQANFAADIFPAIQRCDVHIFCVVIRNRGRVSVRIQPEKIELKLRTEVDGNAFALGLGNRLL
ncbi:hypothetical protein SDC9_201322 [bioreactor metagenome]|uniref:Uncharacterized protein n=1 Tax=bioreactor metagenome TaxID=1076179 RepID=A0A645IQK8_9ZZZZ